MFRIKETDSKSSTWMMFNTNRGKSQTWTTSSCRKMNAKCNFMHVNNINMTLIEIFFL